jgi:hypothetical protein
MDGTIRLMYPMACVARFIQMRLQGYRCVGLHRDFVGHGDR